MSRPGSLAGEQLRAFVERIEHVEEEIKALTEGKKEIYAEAKNEGYDVKILKEVIRLRKQDERERDEKESMLDLYMQAL
ncbi:MAG TPA: DUF2312 domain-containing protein, partial [Beijerinckiaceae bacterium]